MLPMSRIALGARAESRLFILEMATRLKKQWGSEIHLYCSGPEQVKYYEDWNKSGVLASITDAGGLYDQAFETGLDAEGVFKVAREYERKLGMTINRIVVPDRHFGRGYALGGFFHPRSRYSEETSYIQVVNAVCKHLAFWEHEFVTKRITLCVNGTREAAYMARAAGMPYRALAASRIRNLHYWAHNEMYETPAFEEAWRSTEALPEEGMAKPYHSHLASRARYRSLFGTGKLLRELTETTARYCYWVLRGYRQARGYYLSERLQLHWRMWRDYRRIRSLATTTLKDLEGKTFVYFPTHVEPETALHGLSPEYFYQHALIAAVSRDLPAGAYLAVKEAYGAIGRRPRDFYRQIADLKNVVLLDVWEVGMDCAQRANAVVTICGTSGLEAVAAGTPVIAFGRHNLYNFLPSVRVIDDEQKLAGYLRDALEGRIDRATVMKEGRRMLSAVAACSFDMRGYDYINLDSFDPASVEDAANALAQGLGLGDAGQPKERVA